MPDTLKGTMLQVIDGNTFDLSVIEMGLDNRLDYSEIETIRISNLDYPDDSDEIERSAIFLENLLRDKVILCVVLARDVNGFVVAKVIPM